MFPADECSRRRVHQEADRATPPVNALLGALVAELEAEAIPAPLRQPLTLAAVWADLCRLAGEELPLEVRLLIGDEATDAEAA